MRKKSNILIYLLACFVIGLQSCADHSELEQLKVNRAENPLGIDTPNPRFSWKITSEKRGAAQTAYRILVASSPDLLVEGKADMWDSKKVDSDQSIEIEYKGRTLESRDKCWWTVKYWDENGIESGWAEPAMWTMGLLSPQDWSAQWIGLERAVGNEVVRTESPRLAARMLRKQVELGKQVKDAMIYICGQGLFECYINGEKVGNDVLAPALSEFGKRSFYMTYDVTDMMKKGDNTIGVILGNGRYCPVRSSMGNIDEEYGFPKLLMQVEVTYSDGSKEVINSDTTWKLTVDGPIVANNEFDGEEYDANKEISGWCENGFDDTAWMQAEPVKAASPVLSAMPIAPIAVMETVTPIAVFETKPGVFIFDMGQNMVGWTRLKVKGKKGDCVQLRFAEIMNPDSTLYMANLRSAKVTDKYTLKGEGTEIYEPRFTYHGFRFVEMTGYPGKPDLSAIEGKVVYDNIPVTGTFVTSNETVNTIYKNAYWGIRGNYRSIPTDCPQRDERLGWLGDRGTGSKGESFVFDNSRLYAKWLQDIEDSQREDGSVPDVAPSYWKIYSDGVTWPAAYLFIADMLYTQFGDKEPIKKHYDSFKKWIFYMRDRYMENGIMPRDTYGDWCMPPEKQELIHSQDPSRKTDGRILGTSYYYYMLTLMQNFAKLTGHADDVSKYAALADTVYKAYNETFYDAENKCYGNNTATANLLSLAYGLVPEENRTAVFDNVVKKTMGDFSGHTSTGLIGAQWIMRLLTENGRKDIAYRLTTNTDYPSWGYMAEKGATTIWELWNGDTADPAMNSANHVMLLGDLVIWYYENLAGIKSVADAPGFKKIIMKPQLPDGLEFVKASYNSVYGNITSEWEKIDGNLFWNISVPANTSAQVFVPTMKIDDVLESGILAKDAEDFVFVGMEGEYAVFEVPAGIYRFEVRNR